MRLHSIISALLWSAATLACDDGPTDPPDNAPIAARLAFAVPPPEGVVGVPLMPAIAVEVWDSTGARVADASNAVTVSILTNPGGATLGGTRTVVAVDGVATFSDLTLDAAADGYSLIASAMGLEGATSPTFRIREP